MFERLLSPVLILTCIFAGYLIWLSPANAGDRLIKTLRRCTFICDTGRRFQVCTSLGFVTRKEVPPGPCLH